MAKTGGSNLLNWWRSNLFLGYYENNYRTFDTLVVYFPNKELFFTEANILKYLFSSVQSLSRVWLFATPWIAAHLSFVFMNWFICKFSKDEGFVLLIIIPKGYRSAWHISSVQLLSHVQLFATPWIPARQPSLFITNSRSSLRLRSIESVMPSRHLILCRPLLLLPPIPPSITVFSNESTLHEVAKVLEFQL